MGSDATVVPGRWLGLDISSTTSGWAVVDTEGGCRLVGSGIIRQKRHKDDSIGLRLERLAEALAKALIQFRPERAVLEAGYLKHGIAMLKIAEARGVGLFCCHVAKVPVDEVPPATIKKQIGGHGAADKDRMEAAVRSLCRGCPEKFASDDESDAVSVALYGALILTKQECPI